MTKFMDKSFSTYAPGNDQYRDNWDRIFGKKDELPKTETATDNACKAAESFTSSVGDEYESVQVKTDWGWETHYRPADRPRAACTCERPECFWCQDSPSGYPPLPRPSQDDGILLDLPCPMTSPHSDRIRDAAARSSGKEKAQTKKPEPEMCTKHKLPIEYGVICPYKSEFAGPNEKIEECDCCRECQQQCCWDI